MRISNLLAAGVIALGLSAGAASAAPIEGSASFALFNVTSSPVNIGLGTTFSAGFTIVSSATGDFAAILSAIGSLDPLTATDGTAVSFSGAYGSFVGAITVNGATIDGPPNNRVVNIVAEGIFTPAGVLSGFEANAASATFSFNQTGGQAVAGTFTTFAEPPAPSPAPEPMSLALFGLGLAGLGLVARRRA
jgi:hypothetical protein